MLSVLVEVCQQPSVVLQQIGVELLCTCLLLLQRVEKLKTVRHEAVQQDNALLSLSMLWAYGVRVILFWQAGGAVATGSIDADVFDANTGWLATAKACTLDTLHGLICWLVVDEHDGAGTADSIESSLLKEPRWLWQFAKLLSPRYDEALPRPRALAILLSAPRTAAMDATGLPGILRALWCEYSVSLPIEAQAEMEAHALVAAAAVHDYTEYEAQRHLKNKHEEQEKQQSDESHHEDAAVLQPVCLHLGVAAAAAQHLATLLTQKGVYGAGSGRRNCRAISRSEARLQRIIVRGMRWAFGQSDTAILQRRGAWIDAALTPLLQVCHEDSYRVRTRAPSSVITRAL